MSAVAEYWSIYIPTPMTDKKKKGSKKIRSDKIHLVPQNQAPLPSLRCMQH